MTTARAEQLLEEIRSLHRSERLRLVERVVHELAAEDAVAEERSILGLFANEPELMSEVCEAAMQGRERDPLRL
jgi:hypothetical protein